MKWLASLQFAAHLSFAAVFWLAATSFALADEKFTGATLDELSASIRANDQISAAQRVAVIAKLKELRSAGESPPYIATHVLLELYPAYREAMLLLDDGQTDAALKRLQTLSRSDDRWLAAEATYFIARTHFMNEQDELALPVWKSLREKHAASTFRGGEALFFQGISQSRLLMRDEAIASLESFLQESDEAPERMQFAARYELLALQSIRPESLTDIYHRMKFSRRRIAIEETGERTQREQETIVAMLEKLLEEDDGGDGPSPKDPPPGPRPRGDRRHDHPHPRNQPGEGRDGKYGGAAHANAEHEFERPHRIHTTARMPWGEVRDGEREAKAFAALKAKFPERYTELVKQYYRSIAESDFAE